MRCRPASPLRRRRRYAFGGERSAVRAMREHRRVQPVGAVDRGRIRVGQQLGDVEPMALRGLEGAIDAEAVSRSRAQPRDLAAMDAVVAGRQRAHGRSHVRRPRHRGRDRRRSHARSRARRRRRSARGLFRAARRLVFRSCDPPSPPGRDKGRRSAWRGRARKRRRAFRSSAIGASSAGRDKRRARARAHPETRSASAGRIGPRSRRPRSTPLHWRR